MLPLIIIKQLCNIDYYIKYRQYIVINKEDKELTNLYTILDELIDKYQKSITLAEYKLVVLQKYPDLSDMISQIEDSHISPEILQGSVQQLVDQYNAHKIALLAISVSEGTKSFNTLADYFDSLAEKAPVEEPEFVTDNLEDLYNETIHKPGLRWRLNTLNRMLGSLRKGDFGFIFARPETGKTTFLASEVTHFATQVQGPILWFNNEEQGNKVKIRCYQASLGVELAKLLSNREHAHEVYLQRTGGYIKIHDEAALHKRKVEALCRELKPSLIIFDQIDKIKGFDNDREDLKLGAIYIWARELAKRYCPVIGVCQADGTGDGVKWLNMNHVSGAKTSKQAEADWILGIGCTHDPGMEHVRYLHVSKNKLSGDDDTVSALRHGRMEVQIKPEVARYVDFVYEG